MRIGYDAKRLFLNATGLGNYARFVVASLMHQHPNDSFFLYTPRDRYNLETEKFYDRSNVSFIQPKGIFSWPVFSAIWRSYVVSKDPSIEKLDVFHGLSHELPFNLPKHVKKVLTVHDVIFLKFPRFYNPIDVLAYKMKLKSACKRADKIVAVSEQTKNDLVSLLNVDLSKIKVIYQGCHERFFRKCSEEQKRFISLKYQLPKEFILNVGTIEARKNVEELIRAIHHMKENKKVDLVLVGRKTNYLKKVKELVDKFELKDQVHFLHDVESADLPAIYQQARLFVYSSLIEGFGIPILEAMVSGVPVLVPRGSCFEEVVGPQGNFYTLGNTGMLSDMIMMMLNKELPEIIEYQKKYAEKFFNDPLKQLYNQVYKG